MNTKIKDLPLNERPRERLINNGEGSLSDEELLAIILKTGTKDVSAKTLSTYILKEIKDIKNLKDITYQELIKIKGIGPAKACDFLAIIELSKRINKKQDRIINVKFTSPSIVYEYYKDIVSTVQENFYCLYLNSQKKILSEKLLFVGTVNYSLVHPRDIFKEAYKVNAVSIICVHNHPLGLSKPSKEDIMLTKRIKDIGNLMGIDMLDHIIVGDNDYYSFLENGKL